MKFGMGNTADAEVAPVAEELASELHPPPAHVALVGVAPLTTNAVKTTVTPSTAATTSPKIVRWPMESCVNQLEMPFASGA